MTTAAKCINCDKDFIPGITGGHELCESCIAMAEQHIDRDKVISKNRPCTCGSGKNYKNCHGRHLKIVR